MTQFQFDIIYKIIQNGAPALADELCDCLNNLVISYNAAVQELNAIKETEEAHSTEKEKFD